MKRICVSKSTSTREERYMRLAAKLEKANRVCDPKVLAISRNFRCSRMTIVIGPVEWGVSRRSSADTSTTQVRKLSCWWLPPIMTVSAAHKGLGNKQLTTTHGKDMHTLKD